MQDTTCRKTTNDAHKYSRCQVPGPDVGDDTDSLKGLSVKSGLMASLKGIFNPTPAQDVVPPSDHGGKPSLKRAVSVVSSAFSEACTVRGRED